MLRMSSDKKLAMLAVGVSLLILVGGYFLTTKPTGETQSSTKKQPLNTKICVQHGGISMHIHPELSIYIKDAPQTIPANIGITPNCMGPVHTHDESGTIHLEFPTLVDVPLKEFFKAWGKKFNSTCIFDYCNGEKGKMKFYVNGKENKKLENYVMHDKDRIEIRYE